jgi:hypothetical protein
MTMTRTPGTAAVGRGTDPGRRRGGVRIAGFGIRLTRGAYVLAMPAVVVSALSLGAAAPGWPAALHTVGYALVLGDDGALAGVLTPAHIARASQAGALYLRGRAR